MGMEWLGRDLKDYPAPTSPCSDVSTPGASFVLLLLFNEGL